MRRATSLWHDSLGARLLGVYLLGSLAHGGFSRRYSDIDVAVINGDGLAPSELQGLTNQVATQFPEIVQPVSIFWADESFSVGRFPPLDRVDYLDHAVPLFENRHVVPARPDLREIRAYLSGGPFEKWSKEVDRLVNANELTSRDYKPYIRAALYGVRFVYSWKTGGVTSNDVAVAFVDEHELFSSGMDLIRAALHARQANDVPTPLFEQRETLRRLVDLCCDVVGQ
jgi:predicted nucleotidyltransferase